MVFIVKQLAPLVSDLGLNILESHAFDSTDGHSFHIVVVDGWIGRRYNLCSAFN